MTLELTVCDYDRIGTSDPIGKVSLGYNRKGAELKHWKEMVENPRRPVIHWHVLKVQLCMTERLIFFLSLSLSLACLPPYFLCMLAGKLRTDCGRLRSDWVFGSDWQGPPGIQPKGIGNQALEGND